MDFLLNLSAVVSNIPQSMIKEWLIERFGLITGTKYYGIICSKTKEQKELHAKKICGIVEDKIAPEHMDKVQFGLDNESRVREELEKILNMKIHELGVVRMHATSIFACSIDGILENGDIVELKTTEKPFPTEYRSDYGEIPFTHMWQMTHNCACTGANGCHYMSYHKNEDLYYHRYVPFNDKMWKEISDKATKFYTQYIYPIYDIITRTVREVPLDIPVNDEWSVIKKGVTPKQDVPRVENKSTGCGYHGRPFRQKKVTI